MKTTSWGVLALIAATGTPSQLSAQLQLGEGVVVIDGAEQDALYQVTDVVPVPGHGLVLVTDDRTTVRLFAGDAAPRLIAGPGDGPGEFRDLRDLLWHNGRLVAFDGTHGRFTTLDLAGGEDAVSESQAVGPGVRVVSGFELSDGTRIAGVQLPPAPAEIGASTRARFLYAVDSGWDDGVEILGTATARFMAGEGVGTRAVPFTPRAVESALGACFAVGEGASAAIWLRENGGDTLTRQSLQYGESRAPTERDRRAWIDYVFEALEVPSEARRQLEPMLESLPLPERLPLFDALKIDELGMIWARDYALPDGGGPAWSVFDRNGALITAVTFPDRFTPMHIARDAVWGVHLGEFDLESIVRIPLSRAVSVSGGLDCGS